jgi:hypothetical protein
VSCVDDDESIAPAKVKQRDQLFVPLVWQRARVEDPSRPEFKWSMATSDVFRCFGKHEVAGNKPTYGNMYGNKPQKQGPSECDKVSKCITHVMEEKGLDASYFLNQDTLLVCLLHLIYIERAGFVDALVAWQ